MTGPRQLILNLEHRPALTGDDFLVAGSNREAVAWLDRWPDWPSPALVLHGPAGCGKTHLVRMFLSQTHGRLFTGSEIATRDIADLLEDYPAYAIDDADALVGDGPETALFHLYNMVREQGRHMLLTGRESPSRWPLRLADLRSRLRAAPSVGLGVPDDAMIRAVLVKLFGDRQVRIDEDVVSYLFLRMERSFDAARRLVARIDEEALRQQRKVTPQLVRDVLNRDDGGRES
ncbi:MAG: DNA replication protein [Rhodospirillales bacterium]|nr:DNA replication protein [Rhodospirillales bacterium]